MIDSANNTLEYAAFAERLADAARKETMPRFRTGATIFNKAGPWFDPVTDADREGERRQRELISKIYPEHGIIGEEFGETGPDKSFKWVLDPVDGTRAFVCGIATWATLIALEHQGEPVVAVIDQPYTDERWVAHGSETVFIRHGEARPASTSGLTNIAKARISTTDPRSTEYFSEAEARSFANVARQARLARFSLDAYAYGLLAIGEIDVVIETGLQHHDYAALTLVVRNAGGAISNWSGERLGSDSRGEVVACATPELHEVVLSILRGND